jgi:hypothetical protein
LSISKSPQCVESKGFKNKEARSAVRRPLSHHRQNRASSLPPSVARIHVRHPQCISCIPAPEMLESTIKPHRRRVSLQIQKDLQYREKPVKILDLTVRRTRNLEVRLCKVQWSREGEEEATWESEDSLRKEYPYLFSRPA